MLASCSEFICFIIKLGARETLAHPQACNFKKHSSRDKRLETEGCQPIEVTASLPSLTHVSGACFHLSVRGPRFQNKRY
jgi:hypothetical protein